MPADYTAECSDEMPMDDATASDNCGEVTMEVTAKLPREMLQATTSSRAPSPPQTTWKQHVCLATITVQDTTAPEFTFAGRLHRRVL